MKILVVQLSGREKIIMSTPIFIGLKKKYPNCRIQVLLSPKSMDIANYLPGVDKVHTLLGEELEELLTELKSEKVDCLINLSSNPLSVHICSKIASAEKIGLCIDSGGTKTRPGNSWFQFFKEQSSGDREENLHLSDIFYYGLGLPGETGDYKILSNREVDQEVSRTFGNRGSLLVIQTKTLDSRKDLGGSPLASICQKVIYV